MIKWVFGRQGMSLIEVMVTTAVASIVMVAIGNSLVSLYQHQSNVAKLDEGSEFAADFSRLLGQNDVCTNMLVGLNLPATGDPVEIRIPDYIIAKKDEAVSDPDADDLFAGQDIYDGLRVLSVTMQNSAVPDQPEQVDIDPNDGLNSLTPVIRRVAQIEIRLGIVRPNGITEMKPRRMQVPVMVLASNSNIVSCATELQVTDACATIGSSYDAASGSCTPQTNCFVRGSYTTVQCSSSDGVLSGCPPPVPNQYTGGQSCPSGSLATESGRNSFQIVEACGKKCTRYYDVTILYYICMRCTSG